MEKDEKDIAQQKGKVLQLVADIEQLQTQFSDAVTMEPFQEYIVLNFLQTFPNMAPVDPGIDPASRPERMAKISARVALPWSHFVRLIPEMIEAARKNKQTAAELFEKAISITDEIGKKQEI